MTAAQQANPKIARPAPAAPDWHLRQKVATDIAARLLEEQRGK